MAAGGQPEGPARPLVDLAGGSPWPCGAADQTQEPVGRSGVDGSLE